MEKRHQTPAQNNKWKWNEFYQELENLKQKNLYRTMKPLTSAQSTHVTYKGKDRIMLASNSYLDLSNDPEVKEYTIEILKQYGVGSGGSRLTTGNTRIHEQLEQKLANFKKTEAALVFNTGYVANLAAISAICDKDSVILSDELNHASIIDGCRLRKAKIVVYKHNDMEDLEAKARVYSGKKGVIVSDAVFSMDGDIVNLPELMRIADQYHFLSMIDEAHATGVIGKTGHGTVEHYGLDRNPDILMGTLSKAIGGEGGFVCGDTILIEYLKNKARGFIFSTSLSPTTMAAAYKALEIIEQHPEKVAKLQQNTQHFCQALVRNGIYTNSQTAIIPIFIGDEGKALQVAQQLLEEGFFVSAIRFPTVKKGCERLRIALMSTHTYEELDAAAQAIARLLGRETFMNYYPGQKNM